MFPCLGIIVLGYGGFWTEHSAGIKFEVTAMPSKEFDLRWGTLRPH
jgi:hypothetical protein